MIIFIQARYSSSRLYGKVLKKILDQTLIGWMIERISKSNINLPVAILTSIKKSDDLIQTYCETEGIKFFRGDLNNVALRFIQAGDLFNEDQFIRLCGDSPLIDPEIINNAIKISKKYPQFDLVTNIQKRTFPKGQSVEIVKIESLKRLFKKGLTAEEQEHVTLGFYNREDQFKIINFESNTDQFKEINLSIDTKDDFETMKLIFKHYSSKEELLKVSWNQLSLIYNDLVR